MTKQLGKKNSQEQWKASLRRGWRSIGDDIAANKLKYAVLFFIHGWLLATILCQPYITALTMILAVVEVMMVILTVTMFGNAARKPGRMMHEWALELNEADAVLKLKGNTSEELEKLLQFHMDNGNIEEADKISQRLLNMVDGNVFTEEPVVEIAKKADDGVVIKLSSGLPNWMQDGQPCDDAGGQAAKEDEESNLPDWMKK